MLSKSIFYLISALTVASSIDATVEGTRLPLIPPSDTNVHHRIEPAWNGKIPNGTDDSSSSIPDSFLPYFVPAGDQSLDDTSPQITYVGPWSTEKSTRSVNGTRRFSSARGARAFFSFTGNHIEWYGEQSPDHGIAEVYLDGKFYAKVDAFGPQELQQQRLFAASHLAKGRHSISINVVDLKNHRSRGFIVDIDAFVFEKPRHDLSPLKMRSLPRVPSTNNWTLVQSGETGVAAMQIAIVSDNQALIVDKVEHNPLSIDGHPAWAALFDLSMHKSRALTMQSNSFCAGGTFLSNGTMLNVGGNPVVADKTGAADFGDVNGLQGVRMFNPCDDGKCDMYENPERLRLASPRWYNTVTRLDDGSAMIIGGSLKGGWMNNKTTNNPTIEYFPPKNIHGQNGLPIPSSFLTDTLNSNLFPIAFTLPDGRVFVAANRDAMIYDWRSNTEHRLPQIPNGVRVTYPMTGTAVLLPLTPSNEYIPEVLICGGSTLDDTRAGYDMSSQDEASDQCSRMILSDAGIKEGWRVEKMPEARIMPDAVTLPDGKVLIVNGGGSGIAGYGNVKHQVGQSNAANPVLTAVLYDPAAPEGQRFSRDKIPASTIPRLYHSVATLTPSGSVMITGSNPNLDRSNALYGTEYRVEWLSPPYMAARRPAYEGLSGHIGFGQIFDVSVTGITIGRTENIKGSLLSSTNQLYSQTFLFPQSR